VIDAETVRAASLGLLALLFVGAGVAHLVRPSLFEPMVPPSLPAPRALVLLSGVAEIVGGSALLLPALRPWAGAGLALMLLAFLPAHVYMLRAHERFAGFAPRWALAARVPMQFALIAWVLWATHG
jgi:uncharacterized membrane protein